MECDVLTAEKADEVFAAPPSPVVLTPPVSSEFQQTPFGGYERPNRSYPPFLCRFAVSFAAYERLVVHKLQRYRRRGKGMRMQRGFCIAIVEPGDSSG